MMVNYREEKLIIGANREEAQGFVEAEDVNSGTGASGVKNDSVMLLFIEIGGKEGEEEEQTGHNVHQHILVWFGLV